MKKTFAAFVAVAAIAAGSLTATPASAQRGLGAAVAGGIIGGAIVGGAIASSRPAPVSYTHLDVYKRQRWDGTGFCQVWDQSIPTVPFPSNYRPVSGELPTFIEALAVKQGLLRKGTCTF